MTAPSGSTDADHRSEPFQAGHCEGTYPDPLSGAPTPIFYWYATTGAEGELRRGPFQLSVAAGAPPAPGPFPAVVISHGSGGSHLGHRDTARALARAGFVVAVPLHARQCFLDSSDVGTLRSYRERPRQLRAALDALLAAPSLSRHIHPDCLGAIGFSAGAYTVLVAAGAVARLGLVSQHCADHPDDRFCIAGHAAGLRDLLPSSPEYLVAAGAGHFAFISPFPPGIGGEAAHDPPGFARVRYQERLNAEIGEFLRRRLISHH
jgi:predicted dienelactone hydrolase